MEHRKFYDENLSNDSSDSDSNSVTIDNVVTTLVQEFNVYSLEDIDRVLKLHAHLINAIKLVQKSWNPLYVPMNIGLFELIRKYSNPTWTHLELCGFSFHQLNRRMLRDLTHVYESFEIIVYEKCSIEPFMLQCNPGQSLQITLKQTSVLMTMTRPSTFVFSTFDECDSHLQHLAIHGSLDNASPWLETIDLPYLYDLQLYGVFDWYWVKRILVKLPLKHLTIRYDDRFHQSDYYMMLLNFVINFSNIKTLIIISMHNLIPKGLQHHNLKILLIGPYYHISNEEQIHYTSPEAIKNAFYLNDIYDMSLNQLTFNMLYNI